MRGSCSSFSILLLLLTLLHCCSAYLRFGHGVATTDYHESRRFGWILNWLNEQGTVGQVFANLVIALFVLPPLGPLVCTLLENCDSTRASARALIYQLAGTEHSRGRSLSEGAFSQDLVDMMRWLDEAYDKYS